MVISSRLENPVLVISNVFLLGQENINELYGKSQQFHKILKTKVDLSIFQNFLIIPSSLNVFDVSE